MKKLVLVIMLICLVMPFASACGKKIQYETEDIEGGVKITEVSDRNALTKLEFPDEIDGKKVLEIGEGVFIYSTVKEIVFPKYLREIGKAAFAQCKKLTRVEFNEGLEIIGIGAFYYCPKLTSIELPSTLQKIGEDAFCYCLQLSIENDYYPSLRYIGESAFRGCRMEGSHTFVALDLIGRFAFYDTEMTSFVANSVKKIEDYAFNGLRYLQTVEIGNSDVELGKEVFKECYSLTNLRLNVPEEILYERTVLSGYPYLLETNIPEGAVSIPEEAYAQCSFLSVVNIPESVTEIGEDAFWRCFSLKTVTIPATVQKLGRGVFSSCYSLESIVFEGDPILDGDLFEPIGFDKEGITIYCRDNTRIKEYCQLKEIAYEIIP